MNAYDKVIKLGEEKYGIRVKFKDESPFMKMLGLLLFFNPRFMSSFTTTIGSTVYFPSRIWLENRKDSAARVLAHELVHVADATEAGSIVFSYCYLLPQTLALLSLLAIVGSMWWLSCLIFLLPFPAPMRTYYELRGYAITDAVTYKDIGHFSDVTFITTQFTSMNYYRMWPFKTDIENRVNENRELIKSGELSEKISFADEIIDCF